MWRELTIGELAHVLPHTLLTATDGQEYSVVSNELHTDIDMSFLVIKQLESGACIKLVKSGACIKLEDIAFESHLPSGLRIFDATKQSCECGSLKCGGTAHSTWCPLYSR